MFVNNEGTLVMSRCGIMTVDPGGKSGVALGWFNLECDSVGAAIRRARARGSFHAFEISGDTTSQGIYLYAIYSAFVFRSHVELRLPYDDIHVVFEDFQLRQKHADLSPVKVMSSFDVFMRGEIENNRSWEETKKTDHVNKVDACILPIGPVIPTFQMSSTAMTYATNQRLREWDAWVIGSEHARDATRHLAAKLSDLMD